MISTTLDEDEVLLRANGSVVILPISSVPILTKFMTHSQASGVKAISESHNIGNICLHLESDGDIVSIETEKISHRRSVFSKIELYGEEIDNSQRELKRLEGPY